MANGYWVTVFHPSISSEQAPWAVIRCGPEPTSQDSSREVSCRVRAVGEKYLSLTMYQISKPLFLVIATTASRRKSRKMQGVLHTWPSYSIGRINC